MGLFRLCLDKLDFLENNVVEVGVGVYTIALLGGGDVVDVFFTQTDRRSVRECKNQRLKCKILVSSSF